MYNYNKPTAKYGVCSAIFNIGISLIQRNHKHQTAMFGYRSQSFIKLQSDDLQAVKTKTAQTRMS